MARVYLFHPQQDIRDGHDRERVEVLRSTYLARGICHRGDQPVLKRVSWLPIMNEPGSCSMCANSAVLSLLRTILDIVHVWQEKGFE